MEALLRSDPGAPLTVNQQVVAGAGAGVAVAILATPTELMADVAKDLTAGIIGGAAQLIVGHPFDTIKVKLQSQPVPPPGQLPRYSGAIDAVKQTIAAEGPRCSMKCLC
ncbi:putative mitochondrial carrier domain superfamily [Helianthus anomalus]